MGNRIKWAIFSKPRFQRGTATIEFSILIVPLLLLLFGVTEYGRAIYQYNTLAKSVRDATRYLSTLQPSSPDKPNNGHAAARCLALYGKFTCSGPPLVPLSGQDGLQITICDAGTSGCEATHKNVDTGNGTANLVTVTITGYEFHSLFNFSLNGMTMGAPDLTYGPIHNTMRQAS